MCILMLCIYISIIPLILISFKSIGFDDEFKEFHDYLDCN